MSLSAPARCALLVSLLTPATGCGGSDVEPALPRSRPAGAGTALSEAGFPPLDGHVLAKAVLLEPLPAMAFGKGGGLVLFQDEAGWAAAAIDAAGAPRGEPRRLDVQAERATLRASGDGFVALFDRTVEQNHALSLLPLSGRGEPTGELQMVTQAADEVSWIDLFTSPKGTLVVWEVNRQGRFDVMVAAASADGSKIAGAPVPVARGVLGWRAVQGPEGIAIAAIAPEAAAGAGPATAVTERGAIELIEVSARGAVGKTHVVAKGSLHVDVELARSGANYLLAWTDDNELDSVVRVAAVAPGGAIVSPPRQATPSKGDQAVVCLSSGPAIGGDGKLFGPALLAWEEVGAPSDDPRAIQLAPIDATAKVGAERAVLWMASPGAPDLVAGDGGFTAVTLAPAVLSPEYEIDLGEGEEKPVWPTFAHFGADLSVRGGEPIRLQGFGGRTGVPSATFGLSCSDERCLTMAVGPEGELATIVLPLRKSPWMVAAKRGSDDAPPRATRLSSFVEGDPLARADAIRVADGSGVVLTAWTTYGIAAGGGAAGGSADLGSVLVAPLSTTGDKPKTTTLSTSATAVGGIAIASRSGKERADTVVAWVESVDDEPQVFAARVRPDGTKIKDKAVTKAARSTPKDGALLGASDVAITETHDGFVLAWVDTRDGNGEIYVAKVDRDLGKMVKDTRITDAPGDAADVRLATIGDDITVVWADSRSEGEPADIYLAALDAKTLAKKAPESRLFASGGHSRSPTIAPTADGVLIGWVEDAAVTTPGKGSAAESGGGARIAEIDRQGRVIGAPRRIGEGTVTGILATCGDAPKNDTACRLLLTQNDDANAWVSATGYTMGVGAAKPKTLATLGGGLVAAPSMVFTDPSGSEALFTEGLAGGRGRIRFVSVDWGAGPATPH